MEGKLSGFLHTFGLVMLCLVFYNVLVRNFTPTPIQTLIGV